MENENISLKKEGNENQNQNQNAGGIGELLGSFFRFLDIRLFLRYKYSFTGPNINGGQVNDVMSKVSYTAQNIKNDFEKGYNIITNNTDNLRSCRMIIVGAPLLIVGDRYKIYSGIA